jgi:anti-sigma regulatory factor (Ser/Thr protein kinase)
MTSLRTPVEAASVGSHAYSQSFPCEPSTAGIGRRLARDVLGAWHLDGLTDRAALIITELIANASKHAPCAEILLIVERPSATRVRVGVVDCEPSLLPALSQVSDGEESGRGLLLIDALADRWGCELQGSGRRPRGKEVWAELCTGSDE